MSWLQDFKQCVRQNVPLAPMTTYKVGGPAEFFAEPGDAATLGALLRRARSERIGVRLLGHGTNVLIADTGVRGLVIRLPKSGFAHVTQDGLRVRVGAGHSLPGLVKWSVSKGLSGLECLQGVPGTVGAALRMNAGGKHGEIGTRVRRVHGYENDGSPFSFDIRECGFVYRNSALGGRIVMDCEMELEAGDAEKSQQALTEILSEKCRTQPMNARSAGCVFKNPKIFGVPPAGRLIDELGLKSARVGGASVSAKHANFLICENGATARDLIDLIRLIRTRVLQERGIKLELEVEAWGISDDEMNAVA
jgi:UDP-N-acetylmuramate dehydrogenase